MPNFLTILLDYFFYRKCYLCSQKAESGLMCNKCYEKLKTQANKKTKYINGVKIHGYFIYQKEVQKLVRGIKYHNKKDLAAHIAKILDESINFGEEIEFVPVPLHDKRQKQRKYNHMELIASHLGCKVNTEVIKRIKDTKAQYNLTQKERHENLNGAFKVYPEHYSGKKLILFDDICTTGATMREMIAELKKNGIHNVEGLAICFTLSF